MTASKLSKHWSFRHLLLAISTTLLGWTASASENQPLLFCEPSKIVVNISKSYLQAHRISLAKPTQLHFAGHEACFAIEVGNAYLLNIHSPFEACGTITNHDTEDYIYTNQVVLDRNDGQGPQKLLEMRCVYEDKYVVSSGPITPTKNVLEFDTFYGKFEADMTLFNSKNFDHNSKLDDRPSVVLGQRVYAAAKLEIPFNADYANDLTVTLKNCYANDDPDHLKMERYHYLISGMCASPNDETVKIYQNGKFQTEESRFSFDMFRFREGLDYIYVHCEIKLCNTTFETCSGDIDSQPFCNGREGLDKRKKRHVLPPYQVQVPLSPFHEETLRRVRRSMEADEGEAVDDIPDPSSNTLAFLSRGPVIAATNEKSPKAAEIESILDDSIRDENFLRLWVFSGVAAVIGIIGIVLTVFTIIRRRQEAAKLQANGTVIRVETPAPKQGQGGSGFRGGHSSAMPTHSSDRTTLPSIASAHSTTGIGTHSRR